MNTTFINNGEINISAVTTFGISAKVSDNPIGYFGTGLKYAIAVLLREGCKITIYSGVKKYKFTKKTEEFRGKSFDFVYMNNKKLGFTTELGKNWHLWQAFRELYCNAKDEGGDVTSEDCEPKSNKTVIVVTDNDNGQFEEVFDSAGEYFVERSGKRLLYKTVWLEIYEGENQSVFYNGIKVGEFSSPSLYTYNFLGGLTLTEDRTICLWDAGRRVAREMSASENEEMIKSILSCGENHAEFGFSWGSLAQSSEFKKIVVELSRQQIELPNNVEKSCIDEIVLSYNNGENVILTPEQETTFLNALDVFINHYKMDEMPQIKFSPDLGKGVLACVVRGQVWLSTEALDAGVLVTVMAIFEEMAHKTTGLNDCTRGFQNYLVEEIAKLLIEKKGGFQ